MLWEARKNLPFFRLIEYNVSNKSEVVKEKNMGENYLDMATVIVIFFALGILLSRLGGVGGIIVRIKRMVCKLMGHRD